MIYPIKRIEAIAKHLDLLQSQLDNTPHDAIDVNLKRDINVVIIDLKTQVNFVINGMRGER
jgi:hypothetical protein